MNVLLVVGIILETLLWILLAMTCCYHHHSQDQIAWVGVLYTNHPFLHFALPSLDLSKSYGGLSFISLSTGLNLALVKLDSFRKTLKDVREVWQEGLDTVLKSHAALSADDDFRVKLDDWVKKEGGEQIEDAHRRYKQHGVIWRRLAIRMSVLGFTCSFVQMTTGLLGLLFLLPALGWFASKVMIEWTMRSGVKAAATMAKSLEAELNSEQTVIRQQIFQVIADDQQVGNHVIESEEKSKPVNPKPSKTKNRRR